MKFQAKLKKVVCWFLVCTSVFLIAAYVAQIPESNAAEDRRQISRILSEDAGFRDVKISRSKNGSNSLTGRVNSKQDLDRLLQKINSVKRGRINCSVVVEQS